MNNIGFFEARAWLKDIQNDVLLLTQGLTPIKVKRILLLEQPWYVTGVSKLLRIFLTKKQRSRLKVLGTDWKKAHDTVGGSGALPAMLGNGSLGSNHDRLWDADLYAAAAPPVRRSDCI